MRNWDERFQQATYVYGEAPNDFLAAHWQLFPTGDILSLGEGEGRNAVFLAEQGLRVTGLDGSSVGLETGRSPSVAGCGWIPSKGT